jgi:hypothetical protein
MPLPANDPYIEAIAERVRGVVLRQIGSDHDVMARSLGVPEHDFRSLIEDREAVVEFSILMDVLAAMVRVLGLDPHWLLTGVYDAGTHRRALELAEANGRVAEGTMRELLRQQYLRQRAGLDQMPKLP